MFSKEYSEKCKTSIAGIPRPDVQKVIANEWKALSEKQKEKYVLMS